MLEFKVENNSGNALNNANPTIIKVIVAAEAMR